MVRNLHGVRRRGRRAFLHPRHRVQVEEVGVVEHGYVIAAAEDHELVREPRRSVIEPRRRAVAVQHGFGPRRGRGNIHVIGRLNLLEDGTKVQHEQLVRGLAVAAVPAKHKHLVPDNRRRVVRPGGRPVLGSPAALQLVPRVLLRVVDPHVIVPGAMVQTSEDDEVVLHHDATVPRARRQALAVNLGPDQLLRVVQVQRVHRTEDARFACGSGNRNRRSGKCEIR